ncbi:MAG: hypothetical protein COT81_01465 [Candidatus Buchananbacteria bacterium CG10_big_fil_rev_8_21_14_0_10_42_9]|uniref:DUF5671 domain-containing protein n=1 Tax=Candidatus Buchananbacteria bacterium CG10_big_fil_rev_8_21_14_0_10_42_9 TaxID=1974526 RepID=A0A2H0W456_9BACT|nr:MAG: hypothetical protein COT81_01465 [Candidatus Buchananbacteria bacterium CG10_big_fil_rev_8_21_14_0_10_42_9]
MEDKISTKPKSTAVLDTFLHFVSFFTLGLLTFAVGAITFQLINKYLPSLEFDRYYQIRVNRDLVRFNMASILLASPIYLVVTGYIHKLYKQQKLNSKSALRRWLIYIVLFLATVNIIINTIRLVSEFLGGNYAANFVAKTLVMIVIGVAIFAYYVWELRRDSYDRRDMKAQVSLAAYSVLAVVLFVAGFTIIGSPQTARLLKFDDARVNDLSQIRFEVESYFFTTDSLPSSLDDLPGEYRDPETGQAYTFKLVDENKYELCSTFSLASEGPEYRYAPGYAEPWQNHGAGEECYQLEVTVDPDAPQYPRTKPLPTLVE